MITKKRITVTLDGDIVQKIREVQTWYILKTNKTWSFSKAIEFLVSGGIDSFRKENVENIVESSDFELVQDG